MSAESALYRHRRWHAPCTCVHAPALRSASFFLTRKKSIPIMRVWRVPSRCLSHAFMHMPMHTSMPHVHAQGCTTSSCMPSSWRSHASLTPMLNCLYLSSARVHTCQHSVRLSFGRLERRAFQSCVCGACPSSRCRSHASMHMPMHMHMYRAARPRGACQANDAGMPRHVRAPTAGSHTHALTRVCARTRTHVCERTHIHTRTHARTHTLPCGGPVRVQLPFRCCIRITAACVSICKDMCFEGHVYGHVLQTVCSARPAAMSRSMPALARGYGDARSLGKHQGAISDITVLGSNH